MKVHCLSLDPASLETAERKHKDKKEFHLSVPLRGKNQHNPPRRLQTRAQTARAQAALARGRPALGSKTKQHVVSSNLHPRGTDITRPHARRTAAPAPGRGSLLAAPQKQRPLISQTAALGSHSRQGQPKAISYTKDSPQAHRSQSLSQRCS